MAETLFAVLASALSIWDHKEKNKYLDQYLALKEAYYKEFAKPDDIRSDGELDNLEYQLRLLGSNWAAVASAANPGAAAR